MNEIDWMLDIPGGNAERGFLIDAITGETLTCGGLLYAIN